MGAARRRGVLLLIVLSVLALFALMTLAFLLVAAHFQRSAAVSARSAEYPETAEQTLDEVFHQVVRGTQNTGSVLRPHSLLEDMYGSGGITGQITSAITPVAGGQLLQFSISQLPATPITTPLDYVGRVITFTGGQANGFSTRIVGYSGTQVQVVAGKWPGTPANGDSLVINGGDFSGTGFGYNPVTGQLDATITTSFGTFPWALTPNPTVYPIGTDPAGPGGANEDYDAADFQNLLLAMSGTSGGVAIPSLHRSALVRYLVTANAGAGVTDWTQLTNVGGVNLLRNVMLRPNPGDHPEFTGSNPSFSATWDGVAAGYRWDVDNDGDGIPDSVWVDIGLPVRSTSDGRLYKPLAAILCLDLDGRLNLNAHGSAAQTAAAYYAPIPAPNRSGVQPYFASGTTAFPLARGQGFGPAEINLGPLFGNGDVANNLSLEASYGAMLLSRYGPDGVPGLPAGAMFNGDDPLSQNLAWQYWNECWRESSQFLNLPAGWSYDYWKYFSDPAYYVACGYGTPFDWKAKGAIGLDVRGQPMYPQMCDPTDHIDDPYELNLFGKGNADKPFTAAELEPLLRRYDVDEGTLPNRLRQLLAVSMPSSPAGHASDVTAEVTTDSFEVPVSGTRLTADLRAMMSATWAGLNPATQAALKAQLRSTLDPTRGDANLVDLLIVRLAAGLEGTTPSANIPAKIAALLPRLLPIELGMGLKMDLNRAFGNGIDDNLNGVVDEPGLVVRNTAASPKLLLAPGYPGEIVLPSPKLAEKMPQVTAAVAPVVDAVLAQSNNVDVDGDGMVTDADRAMARQLMARQLYMMMLLLTNYQVQTAGHPSDSEKAEARLIAQWSVNVVDYRDRDSIMTPFEFDYCPFTDEGTSGDTWNVDGVLGTAAYPSPDDNETANPWRGLVWGCERPELLLTETLAFHDRATEDLAITGVTNPITTKPDDYHYVPNDTNNQDPELNQKKRPRGSLFVEIYNPWTVEEPPSGEFGAYNVPGVDLSKKAPGSNSPIWRLAIYDDPNKTIDPDNPRYDPANPGTPRDPDRTVYLADISGSMDVTHGSNEVQHFPSHPVAAPLRPGQYCVIGPGDNEMPAGSETTTYLGLRNGTTKPDNTTRRIVLQDFTGGGAFDVTFNRTSGSDLQPLLSVPEINAPMTIAVDKAKTSAGSRNLRLSISEPHDGYPATGYNTANAFDPNSQVYPDPYPFPLDHYPNPSGAAPGTANPLWGQLSQNGTYVGFRVIHLERLANPLLPWDENANPYRTVDVMIVDLTTFNGTPQTAGHTGDDPSPAGATAPDVASSTADYFCSRQRGTNGDAVNENDLWMQERLVNRAAGVLPSNKTAQTATIDPIANADLTSTHAFSAGLHHTLGYLNWYLNGGQAAPRDGSLGPLYVGAPRGAPFPWLRWANRPFVSPTELLEVPALGSGWLLRNPADNDTTKYPLGVAFNLLQTGTPNPYANENENFTHLLDFAYSGTSGSFAASFGCTPGTLDRILDAVEVPSPYVDAQIQANPSVMASTTGHTFAPPFNRIPTWRKPGLVNLNTIASPVVWRGLVNFFPDMATDPTTLAMRTDWASFVDSRRGFTPAAGGMYPTDFANPFRGAAGAQLVPPLATGAAWPTANAEVAGTKLRQAPSNSNPLLAYDTADPTTNSRRNPYFRYQMLERLGNLTTTRSSVYAVWITIGNFEVKSGAVDAAHPDGYRLAKELGSDTGDIKRHRAFYIFDRSIPVGFQRGANLNVDKATLLKRFIE